jgi:hypothetical protein
MRPNFHYMRQFIFYLAILSFSCYKDNGKEVKPGVYARVGSVELNKEDLFPFNQKTPDKETLNSAIKNWIDQTVLLSEAKKEGFENDVALLKKRDSYYKELVVASFVESFISSKVSVSKEDIRLYYKKNKGEFLRGFDEIKIEQYVLNSRKVANRLVASFNSKKGVDLSKFKIESIRSKVIRSGTFPKSIDDELFIKRKNIVGPVFLGKEISVLKVLNRNNKGSTKGVNEVYDEIYQRVFKIKSLEAKVSLLDSLKKTVNISISPEYQ